MQHLLKTLTLSSCMYFRPVGSNFSLGEPLSNEIVAAQWRVQHANREVKPARKASARSKRAKQAREARNIGGSGNFEF